MLPKLNCRAIAATDTVCLRHRVLWPDKPKKDVILEGDISAFHFGAFYNSSLVGVLSCFPDGNAVRLRKFAIEPAFQGQGIGSTLLSYCIAEMRSKNFDHIWCDARHKALSIYERLGFEIDSDVFFKSGIAYQRGCLKLSIGEAL